MTSAETRAPARTVPLLPTSVQVKPPSVDLRTPLPASESGCRSATPRPAYRTLGLDFDWARAPIGVRIVLPWPSLTLEVSGTQLLPPSVVRQMPPLGVPTR